MRMSRALAVVLVGCASANGAGPSDGPIGAGNPDAPGQPFLDAPARPIDAFQFHDAPAPPPPDAFVFRDAPPPPDACVVMTTQLLLNPVFDATPVGTDWQATPIDPMYPLITNGAIAAQSPPYYAWMGGLAGSDEGEESVTDLLYQDVTVPANTTQLVLTGYYAVGTDETTTTTVYDTGTFELTQTDGTPIEGVLALSNLSATSGWVAFSHPVTANLSGQTVRVFMTTTNDIVNETGFLFDTLALKATHCD
ncbi:MAG TPA: hypothetical protein VMJ10_18190 [Kofleriaceae bacterium]|nr:hypothetical protein [Kofleriaceae bacterium]